MKRATLEWIDKAEGDWRVAQREMQASEPVWDAICFHAQQCAEKYLKALLEEQGIAFGKTHDLVLLLSLTGGQLPEIDAKQADLGYLSPLGIVARYPGTETDPQMAANALRIAGEVRAIMRSRLGIP